MTTSPEHDPNPSIFWGRAIIDELVAAGVTHVCISPGSRSTPLTLAAASHPDIHVHNHIDERSSAFFALGLAKASGTPVALVCTSGSAVAHYLPAFIEAFHARYPIVALSADRPVELMDTGAGQTIAQQDILSSHVVAKTHLETPVLNAQAVRRMRNTIQRVMLRAKGLPGSTAQPGPVHINVPFQEPLAPLETHDPLLKALTQDHPEVAAGRSDKKPWIQNHLPYTQTDANTLHLIANMIKNSSRGVIVCGPMEPSHDTLLEPIRKLIEATNFVLMADPTSTARFGLEHANNISTYDAILRSPALRASDTFKPDLILRFGAQPTSKVYRFWREAHPDTTEILIDSFALAMDHPQLAQHLIAAHPSRFIAQLLETLPETPQPTTSDWQEQWSTAHTLTLEQLQNALENTPIWEGQIAQTITSYLPEEHDIFVASSMPIRDMDTFSQHSQSPRIVYANRGANGIDGLIAAAAGVSAANQRLCTLLIGDVAFLHDASSLLTALRGPSPDTPVKLHILVINNAGGGIFSYLPIAKTQNEHFETHFITPHSVHIEPLCLAYGAHYTSTSSLEELQHHVQSIASTHSGHEVHVTEIKVEREHNVRQHHLLWENLTGQLEQRFSLSQTT